MKKIGIIGLGWLGEALAFQLTKNELPVWGTYRSSIPEFKNSFRLEDELPQADIVVFSFPPNRNNKNQFAQDLLSLVHRFNSDTRFILISSTSVYSTSNKQCIEVQHEVKYESENPNFIAECELTNLLGNRLTIIRLAGLVGGDRYPVRVMSQSGKSYSGNDPVNLIHQTDAVGLICCVIEKGIFGQIINGCSSEHPSKSDYYSWMAQQLKIKAPNFLNSAETLKTVSNKKSVELGYNYHFTSPYDFPIIL